MQGPPRERRRPARLRRLLPRPGRRARARRRRALPHPRRGHHRVRRPGPGRGHRSRTPTSRTSSSSAAQRARPCSSWPTRSTTPTWASPTSCGARTSSTSRPKVLLLREALGVDRRPGVRPPAAHRQRAAQEAVEAPRRRLGRRLHRPRLPARGHGQLPRHRSAGARPTASRSARSSEIVELFRLEDVNAVARLLRPQEAEPLQRRVHPGAAGRRVHRALPALAARPRCAVGRRPDAFDAEVFAAVAPLVQERVKRLDEVPGYVDFLFLDRARHRRRLVAEGHGQGPRRAVLVLDAAIDAAVADPVLDWTAPAIERRRHRLDRRRRPQPEQGPGPDPGGRHRSHRRPAAVRVARGPGPRPHARPTADGPRAGSEPMAVAIVIRLLQAGRQGAARAGRPARRLPGVSRSPRCGGRRARTRPPTAGQRHRGPGRGAVQRPASPVLQARLDHAADLYDQGVAPMIVVTGGKQAGRPLHRGPTPASTTCATGASPRTASRSRSTAPTATRSSRPPRRVIIRQAGLDRGRAGVGPVPLAARSPQIAERGRPRPRTCRPTTRRRPCARWPGRRPPSRWAGSSATAGCRPALTDLGFRRGGSESVEFARPLGAHLRGWCNWQHSRFWSCLWGFESSPPSSVRRRSGGVTGSRHPAGAGPFHLPTRWSNHQATWPCFVSARTFTLPSSPVVAPTTST